ncbi:MAG: tRNA uridine-5-carboxymethylaminomethyl(34) synthesis GTPase MnmE [Succinatimonas hippei]|nr:tRNA uridine-5-carboxymethylaminomethyl(34) synthesis GTPase MnmE [Succinatimonas hippei]
MPENNIETIVAIATPHGRGGVAITRVSGPQAKSAVRALCSLEPVPRHAYFREFKSGNELLDEGIVIFFKAPNSYTGEDVAEFQGHAGNIAPQRVLKALLKIPGIRQAGPGEFTRRAFENGRIDLTEAEAVEDLISAGSEAAAKAAMASLSGAFFKDAEKITDDLTKFRVHLEACLDFPEEHEDFFDSGKAASELQEIINFTENGLKKATQGMILSEGARIAIAGAPNAGKSSLLNALSGEERAIVTNIPGTTRDILTSEIDIDGVVVSFTDTAGIRDNPTDEIETIGINKAIEAVKKADLTIMLLDSSSKPDGAAELFTKIKTLNNDPDRLMLVLSKSDLCQNSECLAFAQNCIKSGVTIVRASVKSDDGLDELKNKIKEKLGIVPIYGVYSARQRHLQHIRSALDAMSHACQMLNDDNLVLCAEDLREAQNQIGEITGKVTSDDILGKIFSTFCIGK